MKPIRGVITALVTPFKNGKVDISSFRRLLQNQAEQGVQGFVINGTTGESPTLKSEEVELLFKTAKELLGQSHPLILGIGSNSTDHTIENAQRFSKLNPDCYLVVTPYYNKPPQRGLIQHFEKVADQTNAPVILYNVPGRTITRLEISTISQLSRHSNIMGIKEASGDLSIIKEGRPQCRKDFVWLSGDDATTIDFCNSGGQGVISVVSHLLGAELRKAIEQKDNSFREKYAKILELTYIESNPIPVKAALALLGIIDSAEMRLPLVSLEDNQTQQFKIELERIQKWKM